MGSFIYKSYKEAIEFAKRMAKEGLFFDAFGKSHPKFGVPVNAILLQSAWAIVLIFVWGKFEALYTYVTITEWFFLALACSGIFVFRIKKMGQTDGIFKSPLYPVLPVLFIAVVAWFIVKNALSDDPAAYYGLLVIPLGAVVHFVMKTLKRIDVLEKLTQEQQVLIEKLLEK